METTDTETRGLAAEERVRAEFGAIAAFYKANPESMLSSFAVLWRKRHKLAPPSKGRA